MPHACHSKVPNKVGISRRKQFATNPLVSLVWTQTPSHVGRSQTHRFRNTLGRPCFVHLESAFCILDMSSRGYSRRERSSADSYDSSALGYDSSPTNWDSGGGYIDPALLLNTTGSAGFADHFPVSAPSSGALPTTCHSFDDIAATTTYVDPTLGYSNDFAGVHEETGFYNQLISEQQASYASGADMTNSVQTS